MGQKQLKIKYALENRTAAADFKIRASMQYCHMMDTNPQSFIILTMIIQALKNRLISY